MGIRQLQVLLAKQEEGQDVMGKLESSQSELKYYVSNSAQHVSLARVGHWPLASSFLP